MPLEARSIWFAYRGREWVLRGVSVRLDAGSKLLIVGPNGSGKTTLLRILGLLEKPQRGIIVIDGVECRDSCPSDVRRRVVYVHPEPIVVRGSVAYNVALGLIIRGVGEKDAVKRAERLLEEFGLGHLSSVSASRLSMGQRMFVSLLRAVLLKPRYLLLDEPTVYLDRSRRLQFIMMVERLVEEGTGVAIATHDEWLVERLQGSIFEMGSDGAHSSTSA